MSLAAFGSFLSGAGSVVSALKKSPSVGRQTMDQLRAKHNFAKKYGYHPLYVMGQPTHSAPVQSADTGGAIRAVGDTLSAIDSNQKQAATQKVANQRQTLEWQQHMINQRRIQQKTEAETNFIQTQAAAAAQKLQEQDSVARPDKYIQINNPFNGKTEWIPNPDLFETPESLGALMYTRAAARDIKDAQRTSKQPKRSPYAP